jgi:hypothetical protein
MSIYVLSLDLRDELEVPLDLINVNMMQLRLPDNAKKIVM